MVFSKWRARVFFAVALWFASYPLIVVYTTGQVLCDNPGVCTDSQIRSQLIRDIFDAVVFQSGVVFVYVFCIKLVWKRIHGYE